LSYLATICGEVLVWYAEAMKDLFNKHFFRFAIGFISILIGSFAVAAIVTHLDNAQSMSAGALQER